MTTRDPLAELREVVLVKWGGSLITDKQVPETARPAVIERLAGEIAGMVAARPGSVILGHGSGSFGHVAASRHRVGEGIGAGDERDAGRAGLCETQDHAARLHRLVMAALGRSGVPAFSIAPSSAMTAAAGACDACFLEPLDRALALGLLPVLYGDVVLDFDRGGSIFSTETVFLTLARELPAHGYRVGRAFWLGETDGILDRQGRRIPEIEPSESDEALGAAGGSSGTDVTGGMRHRLESTLELAALGVESWILDGRRENVLDLAAGASSSAQGTRIAARS